MQEQGNNAGANPGKLALFRERVPQLTFFGD